MPWPDAPGRSKQWDLQGCVSFALLAGGNILRNPGPLAAVGRDQKSFMAGKTISADVDAIASARVIGCCLATGAAAGNLAAQWLKSAAPQ